MRKIFCVIISICFAVSAFAQSQEFHEMPVNEFKPFSHMAVGFDLVNLDGIGIQVAFPLNSYFQLRGTFQFMDAHIGAYNAIAKSIGNSKGIDYLKGGIIPFQYRFKGLSVDMGVISFDQVDLDASFQSRNMSVLVDFFPWKKNSFHFTAGAVYSFTSKGNLTASVMLLENGENAVVPDDRASTRVYGITTDPDGVFHAGVRYKLNRMRPYIGIGTGRPVSPDKRFSLAFDFGFQVTGGAQVFTYDYMEDSKRPKVVPLDVAWMDQYSGLKDRIGESSYESVRQYLSYLDMIPVVPVLKLSLFVRLF